MIPWLGPDLRFPALDTALDEPNGLLAAGGDLSPQRIVAAYRRGIFPWFSPGQPILWWSPDPRMVLPTGEFRVSHSLRKRVRRREFEVRVDTAFAEVIRACADTPREGQGGTWITAEMCNAYCTLHERGYAHCVESWQDGRLVGGLYGLHLGRVFFGESMFASVTDASKVAMVHLVGLLRARNVPLIDCQQETPHLASMGARPIPRAKFAGQLAQLIHSAEPADPWPVGVDPLPERT
jgi:leucyl/phenylalanyl-tRNA--protein transferase